MNDNLPQSHEQLVGEFVSTIQLIKDTRKKLGANYDTRGQTEITYEDNQEDEKIS